MKYENINVDNKVVECSDDKKYDKKTLLENFNEFISKCGYKIVGEVNLKKSPYVIKIQNQFREYKLIVFYKNITGAGWSTKPHVKRVQVTNVRMGDVSKYVSTSNSETFVILGYYNYDNNPIMVAWNAYHYVYHNTTRSCYVDINTLHEGYLNGFFKTVYAKQDVWVFTAEYFDKFLNEYIESNRVN